MSPHVDLQSARPHELVVAYLTNVWPLTRVPPLVVSKVALGSEAHIAVSKVTPEGFLAVVNAHVGK